VEVNFVILVNMKTNFYSDQRLDEGCGAWISRSQTLHLYCVFLSLCDESRV